jgi:hypothetical protein
MNSSEIQPGSGAHTGTHTTAPFDTHEHSSTHTGTHTGVHTDERAATHTGVPTGDHNTTHSAAHTEPHSGGLKEKIASAFRSPAVKKHDKVLAESVDHIVAEGNPGALPDLSDNTRLSSDLNTAGMTDHEKAKLLKEERHGNSLNNEFVLVGGGPPGLISPAYGEYYKPDAVAQGRADVNRN